MGGGGSLSQHFRTFILLVLQYVSYYCHAMGDCSRGSTLFSLATLFSATYYMEHLYHAFYCRLIEISFLEQAYYEALQEIYKKKTSFFFRSGVFLSDQF